MDKTVEELKEKLVELNAKILYYEELRASSLKKLFINKCEYCECYDGIHKSNCKFIVNL